MKSLVGSVSVMPAQASADVVALDVWQDAEGLVDAPDNVKEAWQSWRGQWRAARREELKARPVGRPAKRLLVPKLLEHWLACSEGRAVWQSQEEREVFGQWRKSMIGRGNAWFIVRGLLAGVPLGIVAAAWGKSHVEIADLFTSETLNLTNILKKQRLNEKRRSVYIQGVQSASRTDWRWRKNKQNVELSLEAAMIDGMAVRSLP